MNKKQIRIVISNNNFKRKINIPYYWFERGYIMQKLFKNIKLIKTKFKYV